VLAWVIFLSLSDGEAAFDSFS